MEALGNALRLVIPSEARDLLLSDQRYYVYIMASRSRTLYAGITNDLKRRVREHKQDLKDGFTKKYRIYRLVYFELFYDVRAAIRREKQIKGWRRKKKVALIVATNPTWEDLAAEWWPKAGPSPAAAGSG